MQQSKDIDINKTTRKLFKVQRAKYACIPCRKSKKRCVRNISNKKQCERCEKYGKRCDYETDGIL
ncbi:8338_t:CDS:2 [Dentiscutata erythropus]|uniref:8338_t:CDS:1 n=1 Tax=Dentiscutata erythropus TaxID=1348616 RepID=A0A9N9AL31_9GLOM|nr:8338_t:CDS:2 [Dentiscutata erythropus]